MGSESNNDLAAVSQQIAMMNSMITQNFQTLRDDIKRMEEQHRHDLKQVHDRVERVEDRVTSLENSDKENSTTLGKQSVKVAAGSAAAGAFLVEIIRRTVFNGS